MTTIRFTVVIADNDYETGTTPEALVTHLRNNDFTVEVWGGGPSPVAEAAEDPSLDRG